MKALNKLSLLAVLAFSFPFFVFASVSITEIMYDPLGPEEGGDRDWIELYNGDSAISIKGGSANDSWRIYEKNNSTGTENNRTISATPYQGESLSLTVGEYVIVAKNGARFKQGYPSYSGKIFVASALTLADTGRTLGLRIGPAGEVWSLVSYSKEQGAHNDGNSLQKVGGSFIAATPTPGAEASSGGSGGASQTATSSPAGTESATTQESSSSTSGNSTWPVEPQIFANAGPDRIAIAGASVFFEGKALGLEKKPLENARYLWNFGDLTTKEGQKVEHVYRYPGEYIVVLDVSSGYFSASDRAKVQAEKSKIIISSLGDSQNRFIELANASNYEIDLSFWMLRSGTMIFILPARTFIAKNNKLALPDESTGLAVAKTENSTELLYPNGSIATRYQAPQAKSVSPNVSPAAPAAGKSGSNSIASPGVVERVAASNNQAAPLTATVVNPAEQTATAINSIDQTAMPPLYKWLFGAVALALISIIGVSFVPWLKKEGPLSAKDFKIIEEE